MRLDDFEGDWIMERAVEDLRAPPRAGAFGNATPLGVPTPGAPGDAPHAGAFEGIARFARAAQGLLYSEEGWLTLGEGPRLKAQRRYEWRRGGNTIEVCFEDGRFFHRFDPAAPDPCALHDCPPDLYRVRYDFAAWPRWRMEWRVRGPRKDYRMTTSYRPARP